MEDKWIIFDETDGRSAKGRSLKWLAQQYGITYVTNSKDLLKRVRK